MTDSQSVYSARSGVSMSKMPKKVFIDGETFDGEYLTKSISLSSSIVVETPETIKNKVSGDKTVVVRLMQIHDASISAAQKARTIFLAKAVKQRNSYNNNGQQTDIIGYGIYDSQIDRWTLDSQYFEQDSIYPIKIQLYTRDRITNIDTVYTLPTDNQSFIYYDIQSTYNFL